MTNRRNFNLVRMALLGTGLAMLAACQTASPYRDGDPGLEGPRPNFPTRRDGVPTYSNDTQVLPPSQQPYTPPPPVVGPPTIESQTLPPLQSEPSYSQPAPAPYSPPPPPVYRPSVTGQVVDADGPPQVHVVGRGDTLSSIARSMGVSVAFLTERNNITNPSNIRPGQRIQGPSTRGKAYVVQSGDTLSAIGRRFNVSATQIASANSMGINDVIRPNQRLMLPDGYRDAGPLQVEVASAPRQPAPPRLPVPPPTPMVTPRPPVTPPPPPPPVQSTTPGPATVSDLQSIGRGRFLWPVDGGLLGGFGSRGVGHQSNGISISAPIGAPVRASAGGTVIYSGSDLADFGNLVLIEHSDGFVTAYAHLSRIDVRDREQVSQNQIIGQVGQSGGVSEPQLYFEMRHQPSTRDMARPFDPMLLLPGRG